MSRPHTLITRRAAEAHAIHGWSVVDWHGNEVTNLGIAVNTTRDLELLTRPGPLISAKDLRRYLFNLRKDRRCLRENGVIWTAYDKETDTSYAGLGALTRPNVIDRLPSTSHVAPLQ